MYWLADKLRSSARTTTVHFSKDVRCSEGSIHIEQLVIINEGCEILS